MRQILLAVLVIISVFTIDAKVIPITEVTIYRNAASVTRTGKVDLKPGNHLLTIHDLPRGISIQSLQLNLGPDIQINSINLKESKKHYPQSKEMTILNDSLKLIEIDKTITNNSLQILMKNMDLGNATTQSRREELKEMIMFYKQEELSIRKKMLEIESDIKALKKRISKLKSKESEVGFKPKSVNVLLIDYYGLPEVVNDEIELKYLVNNVSWNSSYDIHMDGLERDLELNIKADVVNNSGENWDNVEVLLSTGVPSNNLNIAELAPWVLRENRIKYRNAENYELSEDMMSNTRAKAPMAIDGQKMQSVSAEEINVTIYNLVDKQTIKSHAGTKRLSLSDEKLKADYYYLARPKINTDVYLMAEIEDWSNLMLSQGTAYVYIEGKYQGKTFLNPEIVTENLILPLGIDAGITVNKKAQSEFTENKILRTRKRAKRAWSIEIKNNKTVKAKIKLEDQIPISAVEQITVDKVNLDGGKLDGETGIVTWDFDLEAKKRQSYILKYEVEYPKAWRVRI